MKREIKIKEPVKIRTKQLSNGCQSIYLDIYLNGRRAYEFLKLYIIPECDPLSKVRNTETLKLANAIKAQRIIELQNNAYGFNPNKAKANIRLTDYIQYIADKDMRKTARKASMNALVHHLNQYDKHGTTLKQLDKHYILGFVEYLKITTQKHCKKKKLISANSQAYYYKSLNYCLSYAVTEDILPSNPMHKIKSEERPRKRKTEREFLTINEIKILANTDFYNKLLKQAFLFSCFCGLRHCDIVSLTWGNLTKDRSGKTELRLIQQKTHETIYLPLSNEALKQLPPKGKSSDIDKVFENLVTLGRTNEILPKWATKAGITKHLTFHVARHTHATMMITLGADLYTVSKLLGHNNIQTTQIYAKIVDESKKKAIDLIPNITELDF